MRDMRKRGEKTWRFILARVFLIVILAAIVMGIKVGDVVVYQGNKYKVTYVNTGGCDDDGGESFDLVPLMKNGKVVKDAAEIEEVDADDVFPPKQNGKPCTSGGQCKSHYCSPEGKCADPPSSPGGSSSLCSSANCSLCSTQAACTGAGCSWSDLAGVCYLP